jgi:hypothetical protein
VLLAPPYVALLIPAFYARETPAVYGIPFFYWYQMVWICVSALLTGFVYLKVRAR